MRFAHFFIERPRFAAVLSILFVVMGLLAYASLPVAQYPPIAPPTVTVTANYPGATPQAIAETVSTPIEEQINGVENMLYMNSQSTNDGALQITVTFKPGTNLDIAQVQVQNRVGIAEPRLPEEVRRTGVLVQKSSPDLMMVIHLLSPEGVFDDTYVSNYAILHVRDVLARIYGVGSLNVFGAREYSMRIWLNPDRMTALDLTAADVVQTLQAQNVQVIGGGLNQPPMPDQAAFQLLISAPGRFVDAEEFGNAIVKTDVGGRITRVKDVARIELAAFSYSTNSYLDGKPAVGIGVFQLPGGNLLQTADELRATMAELATHFPKGLEYRIAYDPTVFVEQSVAAVNETILEAGLLVILVIVAFLQSWRTAIVPIVTIPVSLIGTFAAMAAFGYSLNNLSLFGLVLAIGVVVDDAIVVVENIERNIEQGKTPREAAHVTMDEVGSALVAMALVLAAVFVPTAFLGGIPGQFYRQFAVTISTAVVISGFNSLTLSPALAALVMKPKDAPKGKVGEAMARAIEPFYQLFNRSLHAGTNRYIRWLRPVLLHPKTAVGAFLVLLVLTGFVLWRVPGGFIPQQDQGYLIVAAQLPAGASLSRTDAVVQKASDKIRALEGVEHTVQIVGYSGATFSAASNAAAIFVGLKPFSERGASQHASAMAQKVWGELAGIGEAQFFVIEPPSVRGLGRGGGFKMMIEDRSGLGLEALQETTSKIVGAANQNPGLTRVFSTFSVSTPQYDLDIDRARAELLGVRLEDVFSTLAIYLGSAYVNDFNRFGRVYRVIAQVDAPFRRSPDDIMRLHVRNASGTMVPLGSFASVRSASGPDRLIRYNLYPATEIQGAAAPGTSSGDALAAMEALATQILPSGMRFEWSELAFQEKAAGNLSMLVFPLSVFFAFLFLTAQYESWSLPIAIILIVPLTILFALLGVWLRGMDNNILTQIGFIVLIGLASKNAILIVEFAKQQEDLGKDRIAAAIEAARLRLRPILMTAFSFILGVVPLVLARGAGAEMRQTLGTAVFSGMLGITLVGLFLTPVFYVIIRGLVTRGAAA